MFPYSNLDDDYWTGYFTSRPGAKKMVKDASALFSAENKLFSQRVIKENATQHEVDEVLKAQDDFLESISLYQHHDAITGTAK